MNSSLPTWVSYLQGLSTPAIAFAGLVIALGQLRLARNRFEYDLYERRLKIYEATKNFLSLLLERGGSASADVHPLNNLLNFNREASECVFLFKSDVVKYIDEIKSAAYDYWRLNIKFARLNESNERTDDEFERCKEEERKLLMLLQQQQEILITKFKPYLTLKAGWLT